MQFIVFDNFMTFVGMLILVVGVLVGVAFFTLLERSVLGYIQMRKGPNKVGVMGLLQPFSDGVKLFVKENSFSYKSNYMPFLISPVMAFCFSLLLWSLSPTWYESLNFQWGILFFLVITSLGVYTVMVAGWASNSKYALLGGMRAVAQSISYEVSLALILLYFVYLIQGFELSGFSELQYHVWFLWLGLPLVWGWGITSLAETNRTPFDLAEGESELVSGFNVEYSGGGFALIFLAEYTSILFMGLLFSVLFLGGYQDKCTFFISSVIMSFVFIWVRGTLPRYRYDKIMKLTWKGLLPMSLAGLMLNLGMLSWLC